ncbi:hypothetical protein [Paenirhodobacter sp.]|uniref:hypothetical protein n=1 Tax=Paenirhodobacter sp. TaxID=1965326 RepID=UPI003B3C76C9
MAAASLLIVPSMVTNFWQLLAGLIAGVIAGATDVFVIPAVPYMQAPKLEKDDLA